MAELSTLGHEKKREIKLVSESCLIYLNKEKIKFKLIYFAVNIRYLK